MSSGHLEGAAVVAVFSSIGFVPLQGMTGLVSGVWNQHGYPDWFLGAGYLTPNRAIAAVAGAALMGVELLTLRRVAWLLTGAPRHHHAGQRGARVARARADAGDAGRRRARRDGRRRPGRRVRGDRRLSAQRQARAADHADRGAGDRLPAGGRRDRASPTRQGCSPDAHATTGDDGARGLGAGDRHVGVRRRRVGRAGRRGRGRHHPRCDRRRRHAGRHRRRVRLRPQRGADRRRAGGLGRRRAGVQQGRQRHLRDAARGRWRAEAVLGRVPADGGRGQPAPAPARGASTSTCSTTRASTCCSRTRRWARCARRPRRRPRTVRRRVGVHRGRGPGCDRDRAGRRRDDHAQPPQPRPSRTSCWRWRPPPGAP